MAETLAPKEPEMHWNAVHEEMWSMVSTSTNMGIAKSVTGTNIQLSCEGGGKMFFHQDRLRKFTNILDFAHTDKLHELADPWGNLTIIMPWVKLDVLRALGQLIYLGNSGNLTDEIMQDILDAFKAFLLFQHYSGIAECNLIMAPKNCGGPPSQHTHASP